MYKERGHEDGIGFSVKYFQNVHNTVRDLLSCAAAEKNFKEGMQTDKDGFIDIKWVKRKVVPNWEHMRDLLGKANTRKCISPTQFNHSSTRGHCILEFEVTNSKLGDRGRLYLCDLAGAEPSGDVHYARYTRHHTEDGAVEYTYKGPHPDHNKTTELQEQGKKINLSLSELTRFFRRLADKIKHKKFVPGEDLPGCNAYFLGKYLKKTILQAHTYLIAAVRPEVKFQSYTYQTLDFAHNASIVKLAPKKPQSTSGHKKFVNVSSQLNLLRNKLREANDENAHLRGDEAALELAKSELVNKVKELESHLYEHEGAGNSAAEQLQHQAEMYHSRGIVMAGVDAEMDCPYLENLDVDEYRNNRLCFPLRKTETMIGRNGDVRPLAFNVTNNHLTLRRDEGSETITLVAGLGKTFHNGTALLLAQELVVKPFDRIVMGDFMTMLRWKGHEPSDVQPISAEAAFAELQAVSTPNKTKRVRRASNLFTSTSNLSQSITKRMTELTPTIEEVNGLFKLFDRGMLKCELAMCFLTDDTKPNQPPTPVLRVEIHRNDIDDVIPVVMETHHLVKIHDLLKQELGHFHTALHRKVDYSVPESHRPFALVFDTEFAVGTTIVPLNSLWNVPSGVKVEADKKFSDIKGSLPPNDPVGELLYYWEVLASPSNADASESETKSVTTVSDMVGNEWRFKLVIQAATDVAVNFAGVYCQYTFYGETYTTDVIQSTSELERTLNFEYSCVHGIEAATSQFIEYMEQDVMEIKLMGKVRPQHIPTNEVGTSNKIIMANVGNIFSAATDLADGNEQLSNVERQQAIKEIQAHENLSDDIKAAAIEALHRCKTVTQKRKVMSKARFGGSPEDIASVISKSGHRKASLEKVRSLVKMIGEFRKQEHETELEEVLVERENDLDTALQNAGTWKRHYEKSTLFISGFCPVDMEERDSAISEIQLSSNSTDETVSLAAEEALMQASTKYEISHILCAALAKDITATDVRRAAKRCREDALPIREKDVLLLQEEINSTHDLSAEQKEAALMTLPLCTVARQLEEVRDAILHRLDPNDISESCFVLSERKTALANLRSEIQQAREDTLQAAKTSTTNSIELHQWEARTMEEEERLREAKREWQMKTKQEEVRSTDLARHLSRAQAQQEQAESQLDILQQKLDAHNASTEIHSEQLHEDAQAMNERLQLLVETFNAVSSDLSAEQHAVKNATADLDEQAEERRRTTSGLVVAEQSVVQLQEEIVSLKKNVHSLEERGRLQDGDAGVQLKKSAHLLQKNTLLEEKLAENEQILEKVRQELQTSNETIASITSDQAVAAQTIESQKQEMEEQAELQLASEKAFQELQKSSADTEQNLVENIRTITIELGGAKQQLLMSQQALEHEKTRHSKQSNTAKDSFELRMQTQLQETERKFQNQLSNAEAKCQQSESIKNQLNTSLKAARDELMEIEDTLASTKLEMSAMQMKWSNIETDNKERDARILQLSTLEVEQSANIQELEELRIRTVRESTEARTEYERQLLEKNNEIQTLELAAELVNSKHEKDKEIQNKDLRLQLQQLQSASEEANIQFDRDLTAAQESTRNEVEKQTKDLQSKFISLQKQMDSLKMESDTEMQILQDQLERETEQHKNQVQITEAAYEAEVTEKGARIAALEQDANDFTRKSRKDLAESMSKLSEVKAKYDDAAREAESHAQRLEPLEDQLKKHQREISRLKDTIADSGGKIGALEGKLDGSKQQLDNVVSKYETQKRESDRVRNSLRESQAQVTELRSEVSALKMQVGEIPMHEAEVDRLRLRIEEGSAKQNAVIRDLQARAHGAESRASRAEEKIVEEKTKHSMEVAHVKSELVSCERQREEITSTAETNAREQEELHERAIADQAEKIRTAQSSKEATTKSLEKMRADHHEQIMELQDRMTTEAEEYLLQERQHNDMEADSLKRMAEKIQREAEEMAQRQEQSWLTERTYLREEQDSARSIAQTSQKQLQSVMLDFERQVIEVDKLTGELRAEHQAHKETSAALSEMRAMSSLAEAETMKVQRLESELRASEEATSHVQRLEMQLQETERALQDSQAQKLDVETRLGSAINTSRVDQLREKVGRLRDAVSSDSLILGDSSSSSGGVGGGGASHSSILSALSADHTRALGSNGELRRELAREQDVVAASNRRLHEERDAASQKIKKLTTILRQAQEAWDREREDILDSKRKSDLAKHEFESAAKLYSRLSKDATNERNSAQQSLEEQSKLLHKKSTELHETRSSMLALRDENLSLAHQADMLRTEVSKVTQTSTRRNRATQELDSELLSAASALRGTRRRASGSARRDGRSEGIQSVHEKAGGVGGGGGQYGVREADEEVEMMRDFFKSQRRSVSGGGSRSVAGEADSIAWKVRRRDAGGV